MRTLFTLAFIGLLQGCTWFRPGCLIKDQVTDIASGVIVQKLQCANPEAVAADVAGAMEAIGLCKQVSTGPLADSICPVATMAVLGLLKAKAVPAAWGCTAADAQAKLTEAITEACKQLPVSK